MSRSPIQRNRYTYRTSTGKEGIIELEMVVESDYLHVGSGKIDVEIIKPLSNVERLVEVALNSGVPPKEVEGYFSPVSYEMIRYPNGKIIIPGSTIKGLVRSRLELSVPGSCYIVDSPSSSTSPKYKQIFQPQQKRADRFDPINFPNVCPVCDLLGNSGLLSRVSFSDFIMDSGKTDYVSVNNTLYEVVTKGSKFVGKVVYHSLKEEEIGMLLYGFGFRKSTQGKTLLLGRFKFSNSMFGRVHFVLKDPSLLSYVNVFISKYNPRDFNEAW